MTGMDEEVAGLSVRPMLSTFTGPRLQTCAEMATCTTQPPVPQVSPGPGAAQCFTTDSVVLGFMVQVAEAAGALESISVVPKNPSDEAVFVAVSAFSVTLAVNVVVAPGAGVVDESRVGDTVWPPGRVSFTLMLDRATTP